MDKRKKSRRKKDESKIFLTGALQKNKKGFGFLIVEGAEEDVFIPKKSISGGMNGDIVKVQVNSIATAGGKKEGRIVAIVERKTVEVIGSLQVRGAFGFIIPMDKKGNDDIFVDKKFFNSAEDGDMVVGRICKYPHGKNKGEAKITQIISKAGDGRGDIKSLIRQSNLKKEFTAKVEQEAKKVATVGIRQEEIHGRVDLRDKTIVTIDGADSKDFDDGVSCEILGNGNFLLGVHIADVAHYVKPNTSLDKEAMKRGNSVYLIDEVLPMLPECLSNGMCSLNPKEDRLSLTCEMEIDDQGEVKKSRVFESIIHSKERLIYGDVSEIIENRDESLCEKYANILEDIMTMHKLSMILAEKREKRGSLDFDLDEAYIKLNSEGIPVEIGLAERRVANKLIEEFMLLANEVIAEKFCKEKLPFVYRVHEKPSIEKMEALGVFLGGLGVSLKSTDTAMEPMELKKVLQYVKDKEYEGVVNTVMLRSMQKAQYSTECLGHFGLALKYYCHFTSPIRRYSDLIIHRIIKFYLKGERDTREFQETRQILDSVARITSDCERLAIDLERRVEKLKKAEYMSYHIGESFDGIISGVTNFGIYVALPNTVEGMVRLDELGDDFYEYEREKYRLIGKHTKKIYRLGDRVKVKVISVDLDGREINFKLG